MTARGFALFDTAVGRCGVAWGPRGVTCVQLPEGTDAATRARLQERSPDAAEASPPAAVARATRAIRALLEGEVGDLSEIALDLDGVPPFHRRVYEAARRIGPGSTVSYGELARRVGSPGAARAVGQALGKNPFAIVVPCHRVLSASGKLGGFSANGGVRTKLQLLTLEGRLAVADAVVAAEPAGLDCDVDAAVRCLTAADRRLGSLIERVGPLRLRRKATPSLFDALAEAIVYQQLNGKAAATIFARVCALFPGGHAGLEPAALARAPAARLRAAGLSGSKLLSLKDLAERARAGELPSLTEARGMSDDDLVERLTAVRGIGRWTVEMLLIFRLGRPDVLPVDDYGVRKGYAVAFRRREMPTPRELAKVGEAWRPYRTVASWYLWRAADLGKL